MLLPWWSPVACFFSPLPFSFFLYVFLLFTRVPYLFLACGSWKMFDGGQSLGRWRKEKGKRKKSLTIRVLGNNMNLAAVWYLVEILSAANRHSAPSLIESFCSVTALPPIPSPVPLFLESPGIGKWITEWFSRRRFFYPRNHASIAIISLGRQEKGETRCNRTPSLHSPYTIASKVGLNRGESY